jgi:hypothetical protein
LTASDALSSAWTIFQSKVGLLVLASVLVSVIQTVILIGAYLLAFGVGLLAQGGLHGAGGPDFNGESLAVIVTVVCALFLMFMPVQAFLQGGFRSMLLNAAMGRPVAIDQLFSGGRWMLRLLGANFLMLLMVVAGGMLAFIPAVFAVLVFWPYSFVLVDTDCRVFDSFQRSYELTKGNRLAIFVLGLAAMAIYSGASFVPCIGALILLCADPFIHLTFAVAYVTISGRLTADRIPAV